jgi:arginyl-tRNA synthetase
MNPVVTQLKQLLQQAFASYSLSLASSDIVIETTKDAKFGDYATNVCLRFGKTLGQKPADLARVIASSIHDPSIEKVEVAGPGFLNFFMKQDALTSVLSTIFNQRSQFGRSTIFQGQTINVEFVSANPTGPMHVAHARGAALGDAIATLLHHVGYTVTKEFYINDAGAQISNLGLSLYARYMDLFGEHVAMPEDGYLGPDIIHIAQGLKLEVGDRYVGLYDEAFFKTYAMDKQLQRIKEDLASMGVIFDVYRSEKALRATSMIDEVLKRLQPYLYQDGGATYLKTTEFGDDKDRVLIKSDGQMTYFLPDIAYHEDKLKRGSSQLIDVLGPDHHGYISRMKAALMMLGYPHDVLDVVVMQLVSLVQDGVEVKMSKRTGKGITLKDLVDEVGKDAARYFILARSYHQPMEFDLGLAQTKSTINPLYYAQYAHARLSALLKTGADIPLDEMGLHLKEAEETDLLKHLASFPQVILDAAKEKEPSKVTNYIQLLASYTHSFYTNRRVIDREHLDVSSSRLALVKASQLVLANALALCGITALESM